MLAATSNPESVATQTAIVNGGEWAGRTVAASIVDEVNRSNGGQLGSFGVVIGATVRLGDYGISDSDLARTPVLAPGFGHQGVGYEAVRSIYGGAADNTLVSSSRTILESGPAGVAEAIRSHVNALAEVYVA